MTVLLGILAVNGSFCNVFEDFSKRIESDNVLRKAHLGACIGVKNAPVFCYHSHQFFNPKSIQKLLVQALALKSLGAKKTFITMVQTNGFVEKGILKGDLFIKASFDPTFNSRFFQNNCLDKICEILQTNSIHTVAGNILIDNDDQIDPGVGSWALEDIGNYYAAVANQFNYKDNSYSLTFNVSTGVDLVSLSGIEPKKVINQVASGSKGSGDKAYIYNLPTGEVLVKGTLDESFGSYTIYGADTQPKQRFIHDLSEKLKSCGITLKGESNAKRKAVVTLGTIESAPLQQIFEISSKKSLNLVYEAILKKIASEKTGEGSREKGLEILSSFLHSESNMGEDFRLFDASGLSTKCAVTPFGFVTFLESLKDKEYFSAFLETMPKLKIYSSLTRHLPKPIPTCFIKSGGSSLIQSYAGYVLTKNQNLVPFCFISNQLFGSKKSFQKLVAWCLFETFEKA